jgi:hypothetical protein
VATVCVGAFFGQPQLSDDTCQNNAHYPLKRLKLPNSGFGISSMNMDDSRLIARFQRLITEILIEKRLGQRRPELTDEFCQTWLEVEQRGLKKTPEYRNVLLRADRHALWLAGLVSLSSPDAAPLLSSKETEAVATLSASRVAA